jgi:tetratricopeptide (TPR) repeat protein
VYAPALHALLASALVATAAPVPQPANPPPARKLQLATSQLAAAEEQLKHVQKQFSDRPEIQEQEARHRRFLDAEVRYSLGEWAAAAMLLYDLVGNPAFQSDERYPDALFYLGDALYQQKSDRGARIYLRELLARPGGPRYQDALARYLEISARLDEFTGIEEYMQQALRQSSGKLEPTLEYAYARWLLRSMDKSDPEQRKRAREAFSSMASAPEHPYRAKASYHVGVLDVQEGRYEDALALFQPLADAPVDTEEARKLAELARLSLGRVLYELGRYDEALDQYGRIPRESPSFLDALYEVAWVNAKRGAWELAYNSADMLLDMLSLLEAAGTPVNTTLAADANLLKAHALPKLYCDKDNKVVPTPKVGASALLALNGQSTARIRPCYDEATAGYEGVVSTYAPVRDQLDTLLASHQDPGVYFDNLLARDRALDLKQFLPPLALRYATAQEEMAKAVRTVEELEQGNTALKEARELAARVLRMLDERGTEAFPDLQEGYRRADAVDGALTRAEQVVLEVEAELVAGVLTPEEQQALEALRREREGLRDRVATLPASLEDMEARRERMQAQVETLDREAFRLAAELQNMSAMGVAMRKWLDDTRAQRRSDPEQERAFLQELQQEEAAARGHLEELQRLRTWLADERQAGGSSVSGEEMLRARYRASLAREHALIAAAESRLGAEPAVLLEQAHLARQSSERLRTETLRAKQALRARIQRRGEFVRQQVLAEQQLLERYAPQATVLSGDARSLGGSIAYQSFQRVRQQLYDLVLKADVGLVDVAFIRKQDQTKRLQSLAEEQGRELKGLDDDFKEVLENTGQSPSGGEP